MENKTMSEGSEGNKTQCEEIDSASKMQLDSKTENQATDLENNIIRQVEYYFSDNNLPRDNFLQEKIKSDDGWISISVLLTFKRLANMTASQEVIVGALLKSTNNLVEVSGDHTKMRRSTLKPLPEINEKYRLELMSRTIYAKGFPLDTNLDVASAFFKNYDLFENITMRTYFDKSTKKCAFKGSVFVTFAKQEFAQKFISLEKVTFQGKLLIRMWQNDYIEMKRREMKGKNKYLSADEKPIFRPPNGTIICLEGLSENTTREDIKEAFLELAAEIAFIDYNKSNKITRVRLRDADNAKEVMKKIADAKLKICNIEASARFLEGEEESNYLDKVVEDIRNFCQKQGNTGKGRGRNGKTGRGGMSNRKRKVAVENSASPPKQHSPKLGQD